MSYGTNVLDRTYIPLETSHFFESPNKKDDECKKLKTNVSSPTLLFSLLVAWPPQSNSNSRVANVQYLFASVPVKSNQINRRCGYQGYWGTRIGCTNNNLT